MKVWLSTGLLAVVVFLTRLSFLSPGYGTDPDAHRLAVAARRIRETGLYEFSREPGHPVQEILGSFLVGGGPIALNGMTALLSTVAVVFFVLFLRQFEAKYAWTLGLSLGLSPLFFIHSVDSMDYVWAISLVWAAVYFSVRGWGIAAGFALGCAIGCRVTEVLSVFPLLLLFGLNNASARKKAGLLYVGGVAAIVALLWYFPVFSRYGWSALRVYEGAQKSVSVILFRAFVEPFGWPGLIAIATTLSLGYVRIILRNRSRTPLLERRIIFASLLGIIGPALTFIRLPHDSGYLLPIVPWVIVLGAMLRQEWVTATVCVALILGNIPIPGVWDNTFWNSHQNRQTQVRDVESTIEKLRKLQKSSVFVAGTYQPKFLSALAEEPLPFVEIRYVLNRNEAEELRGRGVKVYYYRRAHSFNLRVTQFDLRQAGFSPL
jgi:hypothetical protein